MKKLLGIGSFVALVCAMFALSNSFSLVPRAGVQDADALGLRDKAVRAHAEAVVIHSRPDGHFPDGSIHYKIIHAEHVHNTITTVGRDFIHSQSYSTGPAANGLNYIALSNDSLTETSASTTLSSEIVANGLSRAIGAYAHTTAATTTTISKTFTCATGSQAAQKAALFTAGSSGTMNHVLAFTQRTLQVGDTLSITFTITIS